MHGAQLRNTGKLMSLREENKKRKRRLGKSRKKNNKYVRKKKESLPKVLDTQSEMVVWLTSMQRKETLLNNKTLN